MEGRGGREKDRKERMTEGKRKGGLTNLYGVLEAATSSGWANQAPD